MKNNNVVKALKDNIKLLIEKGQFQQAKMLLVDYKKIAKNDVEIYSIMGVVAIMEGNLDEAESIIIEGLTIDKGNLDLLYNLAYVYETKAEYLKALETYENMVFHMEDTPERLETIKALNKLEDNHREEIQNQLEERKYDKEEMSFNGKERNLHLMYDSQYCGKFIDFVNLHFPNDEHKFVIIGDKNQKLKFIDINNVKNAEILNLQYELNKLLYYIDDSSKVFIHYLFDYFCELVCKFDVNKPIYWSFWGGDLYNYIDMEMFDPLTKELINNLGFNVNSLVDKNLIQYIYRKVCIRKIYKIGIVFKNDYNILKKNFITQTQCSDFIFPLPVDFEKLDIFHSSNKFDYLVKKYKRIILVGNSANPSNNHLDILYKLNNLKYQEFCIVMPLSYGCNQTYINEIVKIGKKLFWDRFVPLMDYLPENEYSQLLSVVDIAIMAHNRQQAGGNIIALAYLEKTILMKSNSSIYLDFKDNNIKVFTIDDINIQNKKLFDIREENKNKLLVKKRFSQELTIQYMKKFFE